MVGRYPWPPEKGNVGLDSFVTGHLEPLSAKASASATEETIMGLSRAYGTLCRTAAEGGNRRDANRAPAGLDGGNGNALCTVA